MFKGGYTGKILRINLTNNQIDVENTNEKWAVQDFLWMKLILKQTP